VIDDGLEEAEYEKTFIGALGEYLEACKNCLICRKKLYQHEKEWYIGKIFGHSDTPVVNICIECIENGNVNNFIKKDVCKLKNMRCVHGRHKIKLDQTFYSIRIKTDDILMVVESDPNEEHDINLCQKCYDSRLELKKSLMKISNDPNIYFLHPGDNMHYPLLLNVQKIDNRRFPENVQIQKEIMEQESWAKGGNLSRILHCGNIGSIRQWVTLTDYYNLPLSDHSTLLLVDCSEETNGRITSCLLGGDEGNDLSLDIIYDNINDYLNDYQKWVDQYQHADKKHISKNKRSDDDNNDDDNNDDNNDDDNNDDDDDNYDDDNKNNNDDDNNDNDNNDDDDEEYENNYTEFSAYIRKKKGLGFKCECYSKY
jgi:hypothetical protein